LYNRKVPLLDFVNPLKSYPRCFDKNYPENSRGLGHTTYENTYIINDSSLFNETLKEEDIDVIINGYIYSLIFRAPENSFENENPTLTSPSRASKLFKPESNLEGSNTMRFCS
jgi:hypothetical protein